MLDAIVGSVRLDVWKDGRGVVNRPARHGEVRRRIPWDPATHNFVAGMLRFGAGVLAAGAVTGTGAVELFRSGRSVIAVGVLVVAVALALFAMLMLIATSKTGRRRGVLIALGPPSVPQMRQAAQRERDELGRRPDPDDVALAEARLWALAVVLTRPDGHDRSSAAQPALF